MAFAPQLPHMETEEGNILPQVLQILDVICGAATIDRQTLATDVMSLAAAYLKTLNEHKQRISALEKELVDLREGTKEEEVQAPPKEENFQESSISSEDDEECFQPLFASITLSDSNDLVDEHSPSDVGKEEPAPAQDVVQSEEEPGILQTNLEDFDLPAPVKSEHTEEDNNCSSYEFIWPLFTSFPSWYENKQAANEHCSSPVTREEPAPAQDVSVTQEKSGDVEEQVEVESVHSHSEEKTESTALDSSAPQKEISQTGSTDVKPGKKVPTRREQKKAKQQKKRRASRW